MLSWKSRIRRRMTIFVLILSLIPLSSLQSGGIVHAAKVSDETVIYDRGTGTRIHTSDIEMVDADHLVAAWREEFGGDSGNIMFSYSSDSGVTWSKPGFIYQQDSTWKYGNVILYTDHSTSPATIYAYVGRVPVSDINSETQKLVAKKSTDSGHTWQDVNLTMNFNKPTIIGGKIYKSGSTYLMPFHRNDHADGSLTRYQGMLSSTDLTTWSLQATIPNPDGKFLQEGFITHDYQNPDQLWIVMRTSSGGTAYSSKSSNGGLTWSDAVSEPYLPNFNSKAPVATTSEANPRYVYLYSVDSARSALRLKTKLPDSGWTHAQIFADTSSLTDQYPMMIEYAPGKFHTISQSGNDRVIYRKLDVTTPHTLLNEQWNDLSGWVMSSGGIREISPAGQLHVLSTGSLTNVYKTDLPVPSAYSLKTKVQVNNYKAGGESFGLKVNDGAYRLMLRIENDGIYTIDSSGSWGNRYAINPGEPWHTYRIDVSNGTATVYMDDMFNPKFTYRMQANTGADRVEFWSNATSGDSAEFHVDYLEIK